MPTKRAKRLAEILRLGGWPAAVKDVVSAAEGLDILTDLPALEAVAEAAKRVISEANDALGKAKIEYDRACLEAHQSKPTEGEIWAEFSTLALAITALRAALALLEKGAPSDGKQAQGT